MEVLCYHGDLDIVRIVGSYEFHGLRVGQIV